MSAGDLGNELIARGLRPNAPEFKQLGSIVEAWVDKHATTLTPVQVKELKRAAQQISKAVMSAERETGGAEAASLAAQFQRGIAKAAKAALEDIPGVGAKEARMQRLIAGTKALQDVEARNTIPLMGELGTQVAMGLGGGFGGATAGIPGGIGGAFLGGLLFRFGVHPRTLSRLGIIMASPVTQQVIRQLPRTLTAGASQHTQQGEPTPNP